MHIQPQSCRRWMLSGALALSLLSGCSQNDETSYTKFKDLPRDPAADAVVTDPDQPDAEPTAGGDAVPDPIEAPQPDETATRIADLPPGFEQDFAPVEAVRPVMAASSAELKANLANSTGTPSAPQEIKLLVAEKSFREEGPKGALRVSFDDFDLLKILNMEPVPPNAAEHFPGWLRDLDGKKVRVRGFMYPQFREEGITAFVLARDNQICCFGRNPKVYDLVSVFLDEGESTRYIQNRPFDVVGTFRIRPDADEKELFSLYEIENAVVIDR